MNAKEILYVRQTIDIEGFDYAFVCYSDFDDINDAEFHKLRKDFLQARECLDEYIGGE
jgi:hypothetical protein